MYGSLTCLHACPCNNQWVIAALTRWWDCKSYACCNLRKIRWLRKLQWNFFHNPKSNLSISDYQGNLFSKWLKHNANLWHWQFKYIENGASHRYLYLTPVFSLLIAFAPSKHTNCVLDMSLPHSDKTSFILSIITSDFVEEIDCNVRQNDFDFLSK